jgi:hypothetical protein
MLIEERFEKEALDKLRAAGHTLIPASHLK